MDWFPCFSSCRLNLQRMISRSSSEVKKPKINFEDPLGLEDSDRTADLAEEVGDLVKDFIERSGELTDKQIMMGIIEIVLSALLTEKTSVWKDIATLVESAIDGSEDLLDEEEGVALGVEFLHLACKIGSSSIVRYELMELLQAMEFLRGPLEEMREVESSKKWKEMGAEIGEAVTKAGLFVVVLSHAPMPSSMAGLNQKSINSFATDLYNQAFELFSHFFEDLLPLTLPLSPSPAPLLLPLSRKEKFVGNKVAMEQLQCSFQGWQKRFDHMEGVIPETPYNKFGKSWRF